MARIYKGDRPIVRPAANKAAIPPSENKSAEPKEIKAKKETKKSEKEPGE